MGYAQPVKSPKGAYYLARYLDGTGRYATVKDPPATGRAVHYTGKREAKKAADAAEAAVREGRLRTAVKQDGELTFREWASAWYAALRLAPSTMANYRDHLEGPILRRFQDDQLRPELKILPPHVDAWEQQLRADGYAESSIRTWRGTLRTCLAAAARTGVIPFNPAAGDGTKGEGRRGVARAAAAAVSAEKVITGVLGGLLVAERLAVLSGRDDEFVLGLTLQHAMLRLGEGIGLEAAYVTPGKIRVEWQLSQVRSLLIKAIPKDGSRGDVTVPWFLSDLLAWHLAGRVPEPCACHGFAYVFGGPSGARGRRSPGGVTIRDVATAAGVPPEAVWGVLADSGRFPPATRSAVRAAARELGWVTGAAPADTCWHWRQSRFETLVTAAASGMFPPDGHTAVRAVPLRGDWPGELVRGPHGGRRAEWCWPAIARGLTPHGWRHSGRTGMEGHRVPGIFAEAQMRHEVQGTDVYRHVTEGMREEYRGKLGEAWREALQRRGEMSPCSPVRVVAELLKAASGGRGETFLARNSQGSPVTPLRGRRRTGSHLDADDGGAPFRGIV